MNSKSQGAQGQPFRPWVMPFTCLFLAVLLLANYFGPTTQDFSAARRNSTAPLDEVAMLRKNVVDAQEDLHRLTELVNSIQPSNETSLSSVVDEPRHMLRQFKEIYFEASKVHEIARELQHAPQAIDRISSLCETAANYQLQRITTTDRSSKIEKSELTKHMAQYIYHFDRADPLQYFILQLEGSNELLLREVGLYFERIRAFDLRERGKTKASIFEKVGQMACRRLPYRVGACGRPAMYLRKIELGNFLALIKGQVKRLSRLAAILDAHLINLQESVSAMICDHGVTGKRMPYSELFKMVPERWYRDHIRSVKMVTTWRRPDTPFLPLWGLLTDLRGTLPGIQMQFEAILAGIEILDTDLSGEFAATMLGRTWYTHDAMYHVWTVVNNHKAPRHDTPLEKTFRLGAAGWEAESVEAALAVIDARSNSGEISGLPNVDTEQSEMLARMYAMATAKELMVEDEL